MVFETVAISLLNRLLGKYFENFDTTQLNLGLWGGQIVIHDLLIRKSLLDYTGIPFQIVCGRLGILTIKIPWKNLYTSHVEIKANDLLILLSPADFSSYDAAYEEQMTEYKKLQKLKRMDRSVNKNKHGSNQNNNDSFTDKLFTQIIKNLQIHIETVHIRYEDNVSNTDGPFAFGVVMEKLDLGTADMNWIPGIASDTEYTFNKIGILEGLSFYWNSQADPVVISDSNPTEIFTVLKNMANANHKMKNVLGPINANAKVTINRKPEMGPLPYSVPKYVISVEIEELSLGMSNLQFRDAITFIEHIELMLRAKLYRKYRPRLQKYEGHYKQWWIYAHDCVVGEVVERRRKNWDWSNMKRHRHLCRTYANVYYKKLTQEKLSSDINGTLIDCEKQLDIFNIALVRKDVEELIEKENMNVGVDGRKDDADSDGWFSWFTSWFTETASNEIPENEIAQKLEDMFTEEEKSKFYSAIDYAESSTELLPPESYEKYQLSFKLARMHAALKDVVGDKEDDILRIQVEEVDANVSARASGNGMKVEMTVGTLTAYGYQDNANNYTPPLITTKPLHHGSSLIHVSYEWKPLNSNIDHKVQVRGNSIQIVCDIKTVSKLVKCFAVSTRSSLFSGSGKFGYAVKAWNKCVSDISKYIINTSVELDLYIAGHDLLIPAKGRIEPNCPMLLVRLGEISARSMVNKIMDTERSCNFNEAFEPCHQNAHDILELTHQQFVVVLSNFKVFVAQLDEYTNVFGDKDITSLKPQIHIQTCQITMSMSPHPDGKSFHCFVVHAHIPTISVESTEHDLLKLLELIFSHSRKKRVDLLAADPGIQMVKTITEFNGKHATIPTNTNVGNAVGWMDIQWILSVDGNNVTRTRQGASAQNFNQAKELQQKISFKQRSFGKNLPF